MAAIDVSTLSDDERLALAKQLASDIRSSLPKELYAGSFTLKSKIPYKASSFREVLIHRVSDLADVAVELYEANYLVPAFIVTRSVVETSAVIYWLYQKSSEFIEKRDEEAFDEFIMKGMLGSKDGTTKYESYNVLTAVDRLDKEFPGLRDMYNTLCELTHPQLVWRYGSVLSHRKREVSTTPWERAPTTAARLGPWAVDWWSRYIPRLL